VVAIVRVDVPVPPGVKLTLVGANVKVMPVAAGDTVAERPTLPVKPALVRVMVDVAELPAKKLAGVAALAAIVKSAVTVTVTVDVCVIDPLTPVTVTVYVPDGVDVVVAIVSVEGAVPPETSVTLVGLIVVVRPVAVGDAAALRFTVPANPELVSVHVDVAELPARKLAGVAAAHEIAKSAPTVTVTAAVWETPLVPVIVIVYVPPGVVDVVEIVSVEVAVEPGVRLTLVGAKAVVGPFVTTGETVAERATLPVKPRLLTVMVEVAEPPGLMVAGDAALAARVKSPVTVNVCDAV